MKQHKKDNHIFVFYRGNRLNGRFELTGKELRERFATWMRAISNNPDQNHAGKAWLDYYYIQLENFFVINKDHGALNSVAEDTEEVCEFLNPVKKEVHKNLS